MGTNFPYAMQVRCRISMLLLMIIYLQNAERAIMPVIAGDLLSEKPKGTVKTINTEDGDIVDCVDIYQQPSLNHPLLKNHTIQIRPTKYPAGILESVHDASATDPETQFANEQCPIRTVPIRRTYKRESITRSWRRSLSFTQTNGSNLQAKGTNHKYAMVYQRTAQQERFGVAATINLWNPKTEPNDYSVAQLWLAYEDGGQALETIEVGWQVFPRHYRDSSTRLFVLYTNNGFKSYCYNLDCPGFVVVDRSVTPGIKLDTLSSYKGIQYGTEMTLVQDMDTKDVWFYMARKHVGYWPASLFTHLRNGANLIAWGGEVSEGASSTHPTTTAMGSGHFPEEGMGGASFMMKMRYLERNRIVFPVATSMSYMNTDWNSYHALPLSSDQKQIGTYGSHLYFGGPGRH